MMGTFSRYQVVCTVYQCPTAGTVDLPGTQLGAEGLRQTWHALKANGWSNDSMGLLCPDHRHMALVRNPPPAPTQVPMLGANHLDRVWVDKDGDVWRAHPRLAGAWQVEHTENGPAGPVCGYGIGLPQPQYGPFTEVEERNGE